MNNPSDPLRSLDSSHLLDKQAASQSPPGTSDGDPRPVDVDRLFHLVNAKTSRDRSAVVLIGCTAISLLVWCASTSLPTLITMSVAVLAAMGLAKRRYMAVTLILSIALVTPLVINGMDRMVYDFIFVSDIWQAGSLLALMVCLLRYLETDVKLFQRWRIGGQGDGRLLEPPTESIGANTNARIQPLSWSLLRVPAALLIAMAFLNVWSLEQFYPNRYRFDPYVYRAVVIAWTLVLVGGIPVTVLSLFRWRRLSAAQAEIHLRKVYAEEAESEQRLLERARSRFGVND